MRVGITAILLVAVTVTGCAESFTTYHSQTGELAILGRRSFSYEGCLQTMQEEAQRLGVTLRYVYVRGTTFGRQLTWPFEPGYACEAAIGQGRPPSGNYPNVPPLLPNG